MPLIPQSPWSCCPSIKAVVRAMAMFSTEPPYLLLPLLSPYMASETMDWCVFYFCCMWYSIVALVVIKDRSSRGPTHGILTLCDIQVISITH